MANGPNIRTHGWYWFEGDRNHVYRILRSLKNSFWIYRWNRYTKNGSGLREVSNPSNIDFTKTKNYLAQLPAESMRPLMIEIQAVAPQFTGRPTQYYYSMQKTEYDSSCSWKRAGFRLAPKMYSKCNRQFL
jgi:DNA repair protein RadA/Sms